MGLETHPWIGQCANSKLVIDTGSHITLCIHLMYTVSNKVWISSEVKRVYTIINFIISVCHTLFLIFMSYIIIKDNQVET